MLLKGIKFSLGVCIHRISFTPLRQIKHSDNMDVQKLNKAVCDLLDKKLLLNGMSYNDPTYDDVEEEVHDLEDELIDDYGKFLEERLYEVHDEYCPDTEVLMPIAYLPKKIIKDGSEYKVDFSQGVFVEADDFEENDTKLVILPNPLRIILQINPERKEVCWSVD